MLAHAADRSVKASTADVATTALEAQDGIVESWDA